jgi:hypothetical protein
MPRPSHLHLEPKFYLRIDGKIFSILFLSLNEAEQAAKCLCMGEQRDIEIIVETKRCFKRVSGSL